MKHQSVKSRLHEGEGMVRHAMKHKHHSEAREHFGQSMREESSHGMYRNQVEMPEMAAQAHPGIGAGDKPYSSAKDFAGQADPIAYGQSGKMGCESDEKKIHSQFKEYHWG